MNPMGLLKLKNVLNGFRENHPKMPMFIKAAGNAADVGSVVEITLTTSSGKTIRSNFKMNEKDLELIAELKAIRAEK